jgi:BirA family biotin operon repressor/biotin-[acetyl-CoA-carboxylase] ligase
MVDWNVSVVASATSTQDVLKDRAAQGAGEGTVVQALLQTAGRGRHGNAWDSPMGNLYMSALFCPDIPADRAGQMAFVAAVALSAAMEPYIDGKAHDKRLKWPNDVLIDGLKVSGILLETVLIKDRVSHLIVGMGVNILAPPEGRTGLDAVKSKPVYVNVFRDDVLKRLDHDYALWRNAGFAPIRDEWLAQAYGLRAEITVRLPEVTLSGVFEGIDPEGALMLRQGTHLTLIRSGDVHFGKI